MTSGVNDAQLNLKVDGGFIIVWVVTLTVLIINLLLRHGTASFGIT